VVLQRLSVFLGGWTLEPAEAVCGDPKPAPASAIARLDVLELLSQLVNKSLVVVERQPGEVTRYRLLETIRQYARDRLLEAQDGESTRGRHLGFFVAWVQQVTARHRHTEPEIWAGQLELEQDNLRTALEWALSAHADLGCKCWPAWAITG
jgi:predicted ATPase